MRFFKDHLHSQAHLTFNKQNDEVINFPSRYKAEDWNLLDATYLLRLKGISSPYLGCSSLGEVMPAVLL